MLARRDSHGLWLVFVLTAGFSFATLALARAHHSPVALWLANGILLGWLVQKPLGQTWPLLVAAFLGFLAAKLSLGDSPLQAMLIGPFHALETVIVSESIRRRFPHITPATRFIDLARVGVVSALAGSALCALGLMFVLQLWAQAGVLMVLNTQFRAHFVGMMIAGSASLLLGSVHLRRVPMGKAWALARDLGLLVAVTTGVCLESRVPLVFLVYLPLLWLVYRHRFVGMVAGMAVVALGASLATTLGLGPFNLVADASPAFRIVMGQVFIGITCFVALPVALVLSEQDRLRKQVEESERRYRMLADNSGDLVMRIRADGERMYVSPSVQDLLGWEVDDFLKPRPDLIHPGDRERIAAEVARLRMDGGATSTTYRMRHKDGHYLWIEAFARLVPSPDDTGSMDIIYTGRDVTERVRIEQALMESQSQLRTITDNIPAVIARIDMNERYTYVNRYVEQVSGELPAEIVGKTVHEVRGNALYERLKPYLERAYAGESVLFEYAAEYRSKPMHFQCHYVPDRDTHGKVRGVYALTTEITHIKNAERELLRLAHQDVLTGLANRRYFSERMPVFLRQAQQRDTLVLLAVVDIDNFKSINDTYGHAVGDVVLAEAGQCLQKLVREGEMVARLGGDEFVVLCNDITSLRQARAFVQSLWERLHITVDAGVAQVTVNMSVGAVICRNELSDDVLMKLADDALYRAKEAGRDTYRFLTHGLGGGGNDDHDGQENKLRKAS